MRISLMTEKVPEPPGGRFMTDFGAMAVTLAVVGETP